MGGHNKRTDIVPGQIFETNNGPVEVIEYHGVRKIKVRFIDPSFEVTTKLQELLNGKIKNKLKPTVRDVGYIGIGLHSASNGKRGVSVVYSKWNNMINRCYHPYNEQVVRNYGDVTVDPHWHNFQNFAEWYHKQIDRFGEVSHTWHIDKDLLVPGNRIYSPETCCVIPSAVNWLFNDQEKTRGNYPLGVTHRNGMFIAQCNSYPGRPKMIGTFSTVTEAQIAYWNAKFLAIRETTAMFWNYIPEPLAMRLIQFNWNDAVAYYGDDARIWINQ